MASAKRVSREAFEDLCRLIQYWNENRLELFEISLPNEVLDSSGQGLHFSVELYFNVKTKAFQYIVMYWQY